MVAVEHRTGLEGRQVRPRIGLRVGDGELELAAQDGRQPAGLLLLAAGAENRWGHRPDSKLHRGRAGRLHLLDEDELVDRRLAEAAELLRPADAPPPLLEQPLVEAAGEGPVALVARLPHLGSQRGRHVPADERPHLVAPGDLLGRVGVPHQ